MKHEAQEDFEASGTGLLDPEGRLIGGGGRAGERPPHALRRFRLKRSIQVFPAENGSLYLLRLGAGDDLVLDDPSRLDRLLLEALAGGFSDRTALNARLGAHGFEPHELDGPLASLEEAELIEVRSTSRLIDQPTAERYDRQLIYFADLAGPGQEVDQLQLRLSQATVIILGCGGLGSWVASGLAAAGIGHLILIDDDRVELSNLNRQLLFTEVQLGQLKVEAAAESLQRHNGAIRISAVARRVRGPADLDDVLAQRPDLVIATADWPPHELPRWVNRACLAVAVPWISAGQFPPRLRVGPMVLPGRSACLACLEEEARRKHPLYDELAAWRARGQTPDASVGTISGVIGSLLASEALHLLIGAFEPASVGQAVIVDLQTLRMSIERIERNPSCAECGPLASRLDGPKSSVG